MPAKFSSAQIPSVQCLYVTNKKPANLDVRFISRTVRTMSQSRTSPLLQRRLRQSAPQSSLLGASQLMITCMPFTSLKPLLKMDDATIMRSQNCEVKIHISCGSLSIPQVLVQSNAPEELHQCVKDHVDCKRVDRHRYKLSAEMKSWGSRSERKTYNTTSAIIRINMNTFQYLGWLQVSQRFR